MLTGAGWHARERVAERRVRVPPRQLIVGAFAPRRARRARRRRRRRRAGATPPRVPTSHSFAISKSCSNSKTSDSWNACGSHPMCSVLSAGLATPATSSRANLARGGASRTSSNPPPRVGPASPVVVSAFFFTGENIESELRVGSSRRSSAGARAPPRASRFGCLFGVRLRDGGDQARRVERARQRVANGRDVQRPRRRKRRVRKLHRTRSEARTRSGPRTVRGEENQRARRRFPRERARDQPVRAFVSARESVGSVGRAWFRESHSESESRARGVGHVLHGQTGCRRPILAQLRRRSGRTRAPSRAEAWSPWFLAPLSD